MLHRRPLAASKLRPVFSRLRSRSGGASSATSHCYDYADRLVSTSVANAPAGVSPVSAGTLRLTFGNVIFTGYEYENTPQAFIDHEAVHADQWPRDGASSSIIERHSRGSTMSARHPRVNCLLMDPPYRADSDYIGLRVWRRRAWPGGGRWSEDRRQHIVGDGRWSGT